MAMSATLTHLLLGYEPHKAYGEMHTGKIATCMMVKALIILACIYIQKYLIGKDQNSRILEDIFDTGASYRVHGVTTRDVGTARTYGQTGEGT